MVMAHKAVSTIFLSLSSRKGGGGSIVGIVVGVLVSLVCAPEALAMLARGLFPFVNTLYACGRLGPRGVVS